MGSTLMDQDRPDIKRRRAGRATVIRRGPPVPIIVERPRPLLRLLILALAIVILGGSIFLLTWDLPPPTAPIEITVPDDELPR